MSALENTPPAEAGPHHGRKAVGTAKTVGTAVSAVTLAAVTVLSGSGLMGGSALGVDPAGVVGAPPNSVTSRIAGVHDDLARAVELQQVTPEQASFVERQLIRRIQNSAEPSA